MTLYVMKQNNNLFDRLFTTSLYHKVCVSHYMPNNINLG